MRPKNNFGHKEVVSEYLRLNLKIGLKLRPQLVWTIFETKLIWTQFETKQFGLNLRPKIGLVAD